jgi:hypothetical protein
MSSFYDITTKIREHLIANKQVNTVTEGDIFDVDLNKQTIFPLVTYYDKQCDLQRCIPLPTQ